MATEVVMPRLSDSMEEATIINWLVEDGTLVAVGDLLAEIETDKATVTYEAEAAGIFHVVVAAGETVALGAVIASIGAVDEPAPKRPAAAQTPAEAAEPQPVAETAPVLAGVAPGRPGRAKASPLARRIGAALGVDLGPLQGSGPAGRIVRADVEAAVKSSPTNGDAAPSPASHATSTLVQPADTPKGAITRRELGRVQQTIARRMAESRATVPEFEVSVDIDMTGCVDLRRRLKEVADPAPSYNDMVVKACGLALREFPIVNASYRDGGFELYERVNVGVAVAANDALVVPTVSDADQRSLGDIARETRRLAAAVRDGSITPPDLAGGTFTVSNLGMFGVARFSAVVNVPQAAILAVGALGRRPAVAEDGSIVARDLMTVTLAADHRILYGADAAQFLARVQSLLEQPLSLAL